MKIFVNGRFMSQKVTGVQRYAHEITARLTEKSVLCQPSQDIHGWRGHLWEQSILPMLSRHGVLWSPCAAGPLVSSRHVVTFHDLFPIDNPEWYSPAYSAWYGILMRGLASRARHLIAVSSYTKKRLTDRFRVKPDKITVIHNGINGKLFCHPDKRSPEAAQLPLCLRQTTCFASVR
jgi:glycosyltransferase involved in cell wall biosynthesis